jgi:carbon monoxide dehydrogenase subunit G
VLETRGGRGIRADFRCVAAEPGRRFVFEQELAGTPFERVLRSSTVEVKLTPSGDGTEVELAQRQKLRGLSRFGAPMMRRGAGKILNSALDGLEQALGKGKSA